MWKPFDLQFGKQLSAFREHQKNVEKEAGLANMIEAADARAMVLADQKQLEKRRKGWCRYSCFWTGHAKIVSEDNRLRIFAMLHAVDYEAKHRKLQNLRHAGTGEWLFKQAAYVEWKTSDSSAFLCCHGIRRYFQQFHQRSMLIASYQPAAAKALLRTYIDLLAVLYLR